MADVPLVVVHVALGSNLGDRTAHLAFAREQIAALPGTRIVAVSPIDETAPLGIPGQGPYLNQMLAVQTSVAPEQLLDAAHTIEHAAGRDRTPSVRWGPRALDIDLVLVGNQRIESERLRVPHPELANREFWQRELIALGVDWRAALRATGAASGIESSATESLGTDPSGATSPDIEVPA